MLKIYSLAILLLFFPFFTQESNASLWQDIKENLSKTWNSDNYELYVPVYTWHNRATYDKVKIDSYNERPWGIGIGVSRFNENGNWHSLYIMEFQDSHNVIEPIGGYAYQTYWRPNANDKWRIGIGYTLSVSARKDYEWIPFPVLLPLFSLEYNRLSTQITYIPGINKNTGNVLFTWIRWQL